MESDVKNALIKQRYEYYSNKRKNFSEEANKIMEKILNGEEIDDLDVFILLNDNQNQIEQYKTMYYFQKKANEGTMSSNDLVG